MSVNVNKGKYQLHCDQQWNEYEEKHVFQNPDDMLVAHYTLGVKNDGKNVLSKNKFFFEIL